MHISVTGATGLIGTKLVTMLRARGAAATWAETRDYPSPMAVAS